MRGRLGGRLAGAALVFSAGLLLFASPASAIQTTTWGIRPAPAPGGPRGSLQYPSNGQTVHDAVIVYNETNRPEMIDLSVLTAGYSNGTYQYSPQLTGLARRISLPATRIALPPHQQARVPVTIRMPSHSKVTTLAAIAAVGAPVKDGVLLVQQRLVILVRATPSTSAPLVPDIGLWGPAAGSLLALVAGLTALEVRKRRRAERGVRPGPEQAHRLAGLSGAG